MVLHATACLVIGASPLQSAELGGRVDLEARVFPHAPLYPHQEQNSFSVVLRPEFHHVSEDGRDRFYVVPHLRTDSANGNLTNFDLQEFVYQRSSDSVALRVGIGRVFWGVVESRHLVDIVNQTDVVADTGGDEKLGQPLVNLSVVGDAGAVDLFVLPGFRERTLPGREGRFRGHPPVDTDRAIYESAAGRDRVDYAARWSRTFDAVDVGLAYFHGTAREPRIVPLCRPQVCNPLTGEGLVLVPRYEVARRASLDLQITGDATLWKLEAVREARRDDSWLAFVAGIEHTFHSVLETDADLAVLFEYLFDGRDKNAPQPFEDDVFAGVRLALNDEADTDFLFGAISDRDNGSTFVSMEGSRRIDDLWTLELELSFLVNIKRDDPFYPVRRDHHARLVLSRYF